MGYFEFVFFGFPIEDKGADGAEFGKCSVEDGEVEVVAGVDPDGDEEGEVGAYDWVVEVVEGFGGLNSPHE